METSFSNLLGPTIILFLSCAAHAQQNPHGQLPVASAARPFLFLIRDPVVYDDLRLSAQQRQAMATLNDELDGPLWSMRNKSVEHTDQTVKEATKTAKARLLSILTHDQQQRLEQIELQTLGTRAFLRDDLPKKLGLSEDQRNEIRETVANTQEALGGLRKQLQPGQSRESLEKESRARQIDEQKQILAVLTPQQRQRWRALVGNRIDVSKLGRVRFKAPELHGGGPWINSLTLTLRQLKGKVVALHFYAFGCGNCKRNFPWYKGWHESFTDRGLVVLGIHTPEVDRERNVDNVRREARDAGLVFPILVDTDKQNWNAWGNSMWPSVYLIDKQGYVRYWWYGELNWQGAEGEKLLRQRIEELITER